MKTKERSERCEELLLAALEAIRNQLDINWTNAHQEPFKGSFDDPFENTGASWENETFSVRAYDWGNGNSDPNFRWQNVSVWWYKRLERELSWKVDGKGGLTPDLINTMLNSCIRPLR